jgi:hypothetical protein
MPSRTSGSRLALKTPGYRPGLELHGGQIVTARLRPSLVAGLWPHPQLSAVISDPGWGRQYRTVRPEIA